MRARLFHLGKPCPAASLFDSAYMGHPNGRNVLCFGDMSARETTLTADRPSNRLRELIRSSLAIRSAYGHRQFDIALGLLADACRRAIRVISCTSLILLSATPFWKWASPHNTKSPVISQQCLEGRGYPQIGHCRHDSAIPSHHAMRNSARTPSSLGPYRPMSRTSAGGHMTTC